MVLPLAHAFCNVPVMPVRSEPTHKAEQVNQLLFGEKVEISEVNNKDWARIHGAWDGYEGWCKAGQLAKIPKKEFRKELKYLSGTNNGKLVMPDSEMWLPLGCDLVGLKGGKIKPLNETGKFKGEKLKIKNAVLKCDTLAKAARLYLHAPYQWGGRSVAGIDCSGLIQMALKLCNHVFPRDAEKQAEEGELVDFLQHAVCGDLAFFDNKDGKIVHVGILLDNQTIIHATDTAGRVVIDRIDQAGIISTALKMRTHNLRLVKRIMANQN
jgi:gamma-D-glutamyl-L-lysine dipeptidyl-peptidase